MNMQTKTLKCLTVGVWYKSQDSRRPYGIVEEDGGTTSRNMLKQLLKNSLLCPPLFGSSEHRIDVVAMDPATDVNKR